MKSFIVYLAGVTTCLLWMSHDVSSQYICPSCTCPPTYEPVCARHKQTQQLRGFESLCSLQCTNQCRKNKYEFVGNGRCGKYKSTTSTEEPVALKLGALENTRFYKSLLPPAN